MAWVAVDIDLAQNPKTKNLAGWGMKYAQDDNISDFEAEDIADAAGLTRTKPSTSTEIPKIS